MPGIAMAVNPRLKQAFHTLFGPRFTFSEAVLNYLQPSGIKSAFREQAKICHPDKARSELEKSVLSRRFQAIYNAYRTLLDYKKNQSSVFPKTIQTRQGPDPEKPAHRPVKKEPEKGDFFYPGKAVPAISLRFGEFLYYSKIISWNILIQALIFKKQYDDKKLGEYFMEQKILSPNDLSRYLALQKRHNQKFSKK
jgi:hypothetical protein